MTGDVLPLCLLCLCGAVLGASVAKQYLAKEYDGKNAALKARAKALDEEVKRVETWNSKLNAWYVGEMSELATIKRALSDEHDRKLAALRAAETMLKDGGPPDTSFAGVSNYMR